jgi:hypothetical protein
VIQDLLFRSIGQSQRRRHAEKRTAWGKRVQFLIAYRPPPSLRLRAS